MSFEVFRRHQRKLLAIFAILAMFGFVVSDSLFRYTNSGGGGRDQPVVTLYGRTIYQSELSGMQAERNLANRFMFRLNPRFGPEPFGGLRTREMVDALILRHEADRLGIPAGMEQGRDFIKRITMGQMTGELFDRLMGEFRNDYADEQVLAAIADQVRLNYVRGLPGDPNRLVGGPMVTPLDIYRAYRDQNEKVSAKLVEVPVEKFLAKVPEPSAAEVQAFYDAHKNTLPDPMRATPGFKLPRQVQLEVLSIDGNALARSIKDHLTEAELRTAYENRKSEFETRGDRPGQLPNDLFAGHPELTPPVVQPFDEVRTILAASLAEAKAQDQIVEQFSKIRRNVLDKFFDEYQAAQAQREEAGGDTAKGPPLPSPPDLKELAKAEHLDYDLTPMLSREDAEGYGQLASAQVGLGPQRGTRTFVDEFFDNKSGLYESVELTDQLGTRYLVRKIKDAEPRVPSLDEVRPQVVLAWKTEKARPLARKAAEEIAAQLEKQPAAIKDGTYQGYRVVTTPVIPRQQVSPTLSLNPFDMGEARETPISEVASPGADFRSAFFSLQPGKAAVAPNQPETAYYAMALERRDPATFAALYAPNSDEFRYRKQARDQADRQLLEDWMGWLRHQAGVPADWVPQDEARERDAGRRTASR